MYFFCEIHNLGIVIVFIGTTKFMDSVQQSRRLKRFSIKLIMIPAATREGMWETQRLRENNNQTLWVTKQWALKTKRTADYGDTNWVPNSPNHKETILPRQSK